METTDKKFRNLTEVLESKKFMAEDISKTCDDLETGLWYAAKAVAFGEALEALRTIQKES